MCKILWWPSLKKWLKSKNYITVMFDANVELFWNTLGSTLFNKSISPCILIILIEAGSIHCKNKEGHIRRECKYLARNFAWSIYLNRWGTVSWYIGFVLNVSKSSNYYGVNGCSYYYVVIVLVVVQICIRLINLWTYTHLFMT